MRVLHFFKTYYPDTTGGIEQVMFQLSQGCRSLGVDGQVLTLSPNPVPERIQVATMRWCGSRRTSTWAPRGFP